MTVQYVTADDVDVTTVQDASYQPQRGDTVTLPSGEKALISHVSAELQNNTVTARLNRSQEELHP